MARIFMKNENKFSIDDAFQEEMEELKNNNINYNNSNNTIINNNNNYSNNSTIISSEKSPLKPKSINTSNNTINIDDCILNINNIHPNYSNNLQHEQNNIYNNSNNNYSNITINNLQDSNLNSSQYMNIGILQPNGIHNMSYNILYNQYRSKYEDSLSRDSDSYIHNYSNIFDESSWCCTHPKVKENWKLVLGAALLFFVGIGLIASGVIAVFTDGISVLQGVVFFVVGAICFIPGSYHIVYIYLAVKGHQGYDFYHLPLFN